MFAMYMVPMLLALICATTTIISLVLPRTRAWFHLASQARQEQRAMLQALAD